MWEGADRSETEMVGVGIIAIPTGDIRNAPRS